MDVESFNFTIINLNYDGTAYTINQYSLFNVNEPYLLTSCGLGEIVTDFISG